MAIHYDENLYKTWTMSPPLQKHSVTVASHFLRKVLGSQSFERRVPESALCRQTLTQRYAKSFSRWNSDNCLLGLAILERYIDNPNVRKKSPLHSILGSKAAHPIPEKITFRANRSNVVAILDPVLLSGALPPRMSAIYRSLPAWGSEIMFLNFWIF